MKENKMPLEWHKATKDWEVKCLFVGGVSGLGAIILLKYFPNY